MKKTSKKALTLIELMISMVIATTIGIFAFSLYQGGVKSSISGVVSLDMLAEGRRVLAQIRDDLKNSCIPYHGAFSVSFNDLLHADFSNSRGLEGAEYSLLRFKYEPDFVRTGLPSPDYLLRPLINIKYRLEKIENSELLKLTRVTATRDGQEQTKVLCDRVSFFKISPVRITTPDTGENWLWNISLQTGSSDPARGVNAMSFYEVVYSDFFNAINNHQLSPRNWQTGLKYSPE